MTDPTREEPTGGQFAYFMVRVRVNAPGEPAAFVGVVERLGTGRKRSFPDQQELLRLLIDWSNSPSKMPHAPVRSNESTGGDA